MTTGNMQDDLKNKVLVFTGGIGNTVIDKIMLFRVNQAPFLV